MDGMKINRRNLLKVGGFAVAAGTIPAPRAAGRRFYAGSYTSSGGPGMLLGTADPVTGALTVQVRSAAIADPSWLAVGPHALYAISEANGTVSAVDPNTLAVRNTISTGSGPAHVAVHPGGAFLFTSLYDGGATVTHPIAGDGTVKARTDSRKQGSGSHAHEVVADPTGQYLLAMDLGRDSVFVYTLSGNRLVLSRQVTFPTGTGPRHLAWHPNGRYAYLAGENGNNVTVCSWQNGVLTAVRSLPASSAAVTNYPGEIVTSPDGRFVYVSNRGADTVGVFTVSTDGATLTPLAAPPCGGDWPRNLVLTPDAAWLYVANQNSGTITWLPVDPATGIPGAVAGSLTVPGAAQILF
ncbi:MAG TPA: lactonase family protein [Actinoplanes sp.]